MFLSVTSGLKNARIRHWFHASAGFIAKRSGAAEFLKKRISDALGGKIVLSKSVTYDDLRAIIITDYTNNGQKSLGDLKVTRLPRLDEVFGGSNATDITTASVERYRIQDAPASKTDRRRPQSIAISRRSSGCSGSACGSGWSRRCRRSRCWPSKT